MDDYVNAALRHAQFEHDSDGSAYGTVHLGAHLVVTSSGRTYAVCRASLRQMVQHEVKKAMETQHTLPPIDGVQLPHVRTDEGANHYDHP